MSWSPVVVGEWPFYPGDFVCKHVRTNELWLPWPGGPSPGGPSPGCLSSFLRILIFWRHHLICTFKCMTGGREGIDWLQWHSAPFEISHNFSLF